MNICPVCESEMEKGLGICKDCSGEVAESPAASGTESGIEEVTEGPCACLELEDGQRFELDSDEILLGRSDPVDQIQPDVDLSYHGGFEQGVSRRHAVIIAEEDGYVLEDLGSTNGTVVNREKVTPGTPVHLAEGDVIHLGKLKAIFHAGAGEGGVS
jgi:hypothetical protein